MFLRLIELITYMLFVYFLVLLFIIIVPNIKFLVIFYIIWFVMSWLAVMDCKKNMFKNVLIKLNTIMIYSLLVILIYIVIHYYWNYRICKIFIILLPLKFYGLVRLVEGMLECDKYHILTTPVRVVNMLLDKLKN